MVHLLQKQIPALSFIQPCSNPIFKIKKQPSRKAARLSSCINLIAGRLLSSRAYFLFRLTIAIKGLQLIKSPTIFQYITKRFVDIISGICSSFCHSIHSSKMALSTLIVILYTNIKYQFQAMWGSDHCVLLREIFLHS